MNRAAVLIPEKLFFKIGEVCDITGIQAHVLRYWESEFPTLAPQKNRAGQRTYRKRDVEMVLRIKELLYDDQYTIAGAKKRLSNDIRGASKLKVVTSDMSAASVAAEQAQSYSPDQPNSPSPAAFVAPSAPQPPVYSSDREAMPAAAAESAHFTPERRAALQRLRRQANELLAILDASEPDYERRRR